MITAALAPLERVPVRLRAPLRWALALAVYLVLLRTWWPAPSHSIVKGIVIGSLTAIVAYGVGLVHRSNGVVNMAQADLGVIPSVVFLELFTFRGRGYWPSLVAALVVAAAIGWLVERTVVRWFARAPRMILMIATLGLSRLLFGMRDNVPPWVPDNLERVLRWVGIGEGYPGYPENGLNRWGPPVDWHLDLGGSSFNGNDLLAVGAAVVALPLLHLFMHRTAGGLALRAGSESAVRTSQLGINLPRVHSQAWAIASMLSALSLIMRSGLVGVPEESLFGPTFLLRALAVAGLGRMQNFGVMLAAALGLGVVEASMDWTKGSTAQMDPILLLLVVIGLLFLPRGSRAVEDNATSSWRETPTNRPIPRQLANDPVVRGARWVLLALAAGALLLLPVVLDVWPQYLAIDVLIVCVVGMSMVVLTGWAGEISLGQFAFTGIGAWAGSSLILHHDIDLLLATVLGGAAAAAAAVLVGIPLLRRATAADRAITLLAVGVVVPFFLISRIYYPYLGFLPHTLYSDAPRLPLLGHLGLDGDLRYYYAALALSLLAVLVTYNLQRGRTARTIIAGRENRRVATAFGIDVSRSRLLALALSAFLAGVPGVLLAVHRGDLPRDLWPADMNLVLVGGVVIGGASSILGAIVGTALVFLFHWYASINMTGRVHDLGLSVFTGGGMLVVLAFVPGGIAGLLYRLRDVGLRALARRRGLPEVVAAMDAPSLLTVVRKAPTKLARGRLPVPVRTRREGPLLQVRGTTAYYGSVQVLFGVDLELEDGAMLGLLGTNGAGKSTLLHAISGTVETRGRVVFDGVELTWLAPHRIARLGVVQVPGGRGTFPSMTVQEHLKLAAWRHRRHRRRSREAVARGLEHFPVLATKLHQPAATLSKGEQQMLALAMALVVGPRLLLIDELSLGLAPAVVEELLAVVERLRAEGITVIVVEQSVDLVLRVADDVCFMEKGEIRFRGPAADLRDRPDLVRSVFLAGAARAAATAAPAVREAPGADGAPALEVRGLGKSFGTTVAADDVSFTVAPGEILGVIGPNGAGKTTVFDMVSGFTRPDTGAVLLQGEDITGLAAHKRSAAGLARSFQDARLFGALTCHQAVLVALGRQLRANDVAADAFGLGRRAAKTADARADELLRMLGLLPWRDRFCDELSTGTRRILDLACQLAIEPRVLLLDEPTSGIAQREAEALVPVLLRVRDETGASLVVIEHDLAMVTALADRMLAMALGRVIAAGPPDEVLADEAVVAAYIGTAVTVPA